MSITMTFSCSVVELCIVQWDSVCVALLNPYCFMQQKKKKKIPGFVFEKLAGTDVSKQCLKTDYCIIACVRPL